MRDADYQDWFDKCAFRDDHGRLVSSHLYLHHQELTITNIMLGEKDLQLQENYAKGMYCIERSGSTSTVDPDPIATARTTNRNPLMTRVWVCTTPQSQIMN